MCNPPASNLPSVGMTGMHHYTQHSHFFGEILINLRWGKISGKRENYDLKGSWWWPKQGRSPADSTDDGRNIGKDKGQEDQHVPVKTTGMVMESGTQTGKSWEGLKINKHVTNGTTSPIEMARKWPMTGENASKCVGSCPQCRDKIPDNSHLRKKEKAHRLWEEF